MAIDAGPIAIQMQLIPMSRTKARNANTNTRRILCGSAFGREKLRYAYFQRIPAGLVYYA
jgi:hypothetical protein